MKTIRIISALFIGLILFNACDSNDEVNSPDDDYLVFGHFYGECGGESCIEIFRLESNRLLEDINDNYPSRTDFYNGDYYDLDKAMFEQVRDLTDFFPIGLLNENDIVIGQPDAGDWGGLYIEYNYDGIRRFWLIDQMKSNVPNYLHEFIDKVNAKIGLINN